MQTAAATHTGRVRDGNEDAYAVAEGTWVVADGMGGHSGGEVAARAAADAALTAAPAQVVAVAHAAVLAATTDDLADMGTTLVHAVLVQDRLEVRWAGDSRAYLLDDAGLHQLTRDHNQAEELLAQGHLTAQQARVHPGQYRLTRALGLGREQAPDGGEVVVPASGRLLLCTDGLTSEVDDDAVAALLADGAPQDAADRLVEAAVEAGGRDNVTVVVVDLPDLLAAQPRQHRHQLVEQLAGQVAGAPEVGGQPVARGRVHVLAPHRRLLRRAAAREQPPDDAGQHVARARRPEPDAAGLGVPAPALRGRRPRGPRRRRRRSARPARARRAPRRPTAP